MVVLTLGKSLALTILLSVIIYGLGEIYLGVINRGVIVLIVGVAVSLGCKSTLAVLYCRTNNIRVLDLAISRCVSTV